MTNRYGVLEDLVRFVRPLEELQKLLSTLDWDFEGDPFTLTRYHLVHILHRYIKGELSVQSVEDWANLIEGREDITFESGAKDLIDEIVYQLSNPELTAELSPERAREMVHLLASVGR